MRVAMLVLTAWLLLALTIPSGHAADDTKPVIVGEDIGNVDSLAFSPDGKRLAACGIFAIAGGSVPGDVVYVWDSKTHWEDGPGCTRATRLIFTPDSKTLLIGAGRWQKDCYDAVVEQWIPDKAEKTWPKLMVQRDATICSLALSRAGDRLACLSRSQNIGIGEVQLWDWRARKRLWKHRFPARGDSTVAFTPDGTQVVFGLDKEIKFANAATGAMGISLKGSKAGVLCLAINSTGTRLACGCADGTLKMWDLREHRELKTWQAHRGRVRCVAFSPDGGLLASGSGGEKPDWGEAKLWDVITSVALAKLIDRDDSKSHGTMVKALAFSPDGKQLATGRDTSITDDFDILGRVRLWPVSKFARHK